MVTRDPTIIARRAEVARLKAAGVSQSKIAEQLGVHPTTIRNDIKALAAHVAPPDREDPLVQRRWRIWELVRRGKPCHEIAAAEHISPKTIRNDLEWCRSQTLNDAVREARQVDLERLDALISAFWEDAMDGVDKAGNVILRALERRAAIIGYEAPKSLDVHVSEDDAADRELQEMIHEAQAKNALIEQQLREAAEQRHEQGA